jgi:hypothetical protein
MAHDNIKFIEREQDLQNEAIRYWFDVDGDEFAVVESGPESIIIGRDGNELLDREREAVLRRLLVVTDEMRAA